jgi:hypothetical protein
MNNKLYKIYSLPSYLIGTKDFINNNYEEYEYNTLKEIILKNNKSYHERINNNNIYKFFGDIDNYNNNFDKFEKILKNFLNDKYGYNIISDIKYTINLSKKGSFHYVIPNIKCSINKLKEIHLNLLNTYKEEFSYQGNKKIEYNIDTSIYSNHWFRLPFQSKENNENTCHIIKNGTIDDFIVSNIDNCEIDLSNIIYKNEIIKNNTKLIDNNIQTKVINIKKEYNIIFKLIDECFDKIRYNSYNNWITIGMILKNRYGNDGFELFNYFSNKADNPDDYNKILYKWNSFETNRELNIGTIYYYAKIDNINKYKEIISLSNFDKIELSSTDLCKYFKELYGNYFIWKDNILYCFNGKYWEENDIIMRQYISTIFYDFIKDLAITCYWDNKLFHKIKLEIDKIKKLNFKKEIVETSKEFLTNNDIEFDEKYYLFGFKNIVFDLNIGKFREYKYDDFILTQCGYDWREPTNEELNNINELINSIQPDENQRNLVMEIISTGLEGRCLEKFIIFNGSGGNGKGVLNDLALKAFGLYGFIANNALLSEKNKTGSNPEKNNIHKKRFVVFREPPQNIPFENSIVKELTGGGKISARGHNESKTDKKLYNTTIIECNKKPNFSEEPTYADARRLIDIKFPNRFVDNIIEINSDDYNNGLRTGNKIYKDSEWQDKHKYAFIKILFKYYNNYKERGNIFNIPENIKKQTLEYLSLSDKIFEWFDEFYIKTNDINDILTIKDLFFTFKQSIYYFKFK